MRKLLQIGALICFLPLFVAAERDSMVYLQKNDTIFLKISELQEKLIEHPLGDKQTLYAVSRFYGMTVNEVFDYNPGLNRNNYSAGQRINIPVPSKSILTRIPQNHNSYDYVPLCYKVRKSDTLYRLAKKYFGIPVDTILMLNNMVEHTLDVGQVLHIGWLSRWGIPKTHRKFRGGPVDKKNQLLGRRYSQAREIKREYRQRGVAYWQKDGVKSVDLYAMHRKAPINSIIAVTNPMTKRTVYAKVIAKIPDSIYSKDVVVVVSGRVAKLLGGKDARFFVKMRYLR